VLVRLERQACVLTATFDSPPANAIGEDDLHALQELLASVERPDSDIRALVFTGEGRFFAAGVDLNLVRANIERPDGADLMAGFIERLQAAYAAIESLPFPTICAMNGGALGGGFELALACDLRIAAEDARYGLPEVKLGLLPGAGGTQRLPRLAGRALALRLIMRGESVTGSEAERLGLVHWALPAGEVRAFAAEVAEELAGYSKVALAAIKQCVGFDNSPEGYQLEVKTTRVLMDDPDAREGLRRFFSRQATATS
jgi:enoyl-CoA hydratase/carnithine racemase